MEKSEFRVLIEHAFLCRQTLTETKAKLDKYYLDSAPSYGSKHREIAPKRPKTQQSAGKDMASVFWDAYRVIFIEYLEKGRTITEA